MQLPRWPAALRLRSRRPSDTADHSPPLASDYEASRAGHESRPAAPPPEADPGLYGVLGVKPSAEDWEIQVAYRRRAAGLAGRRVMFRDQLKEVNAAYLVLGNAARRAEYDRQRSTAAVDHTAPIAETNRGTVRYPRFRHPRSGAPPLGSNAAEVLGVVLVMAASVAAAAYFLEQVSADFAPLSNFARVIGLGSPQRAVGLSELPSIARVPITGPAAVASPSPVSNLPLVEQFRGTSVSVSDSRLPGNAQVTVIVRLQRNGLPVAGQEVWAVVQYRTTQERVPATGAARTDSTGATTLSVNVGNATPGFEVKVDVKTLVEGQELSWPASFTPR